MYKPGQSIIVKINGIPQDATIRSVLETPEGMLIVDFGHEQVAIVHERDVVRD